MEKIAFVLDANDLAGSREPNTDALTGEVGLMRFLDASSLITLLSAWAALPGVKL